MTNIGFKPQLKAQNPIVPFTGLGVGLEYSPALRPERLPVVPKGIWSNLQVMDWGFHL